MAVSVWVNISLLYNSTLHKRPKVFFFSFFFGGGGGNVSYAIKYGTRNNVISHKSVFCTNLKSEVKK